MFSPNSVYLAKDVMTKAGDAWNRIHAMDANISRHSDSIGESPLIDAISNYVKQLKNGDLLLSLGFSQNDHQIYFYAYLPKEIVEAICRILPQPYFQIPCKIKDGSKNDFTFEKRLELSDLLREPLSGNMEFYKCRLFSRNIGMKGNYLCDIILGWSDPRGIIKINTTPFLQRLLEWDASKDLVIVAGNKAEVKCHRIIFAAQSDVLSAMVSEENGMQEGQTGRVQMPENSEEGLSHLIRYFYGQELKSSELPCEVAVELFKTAHKYKLTELEDCLARFFLRNGKDWFTPDELLELYFHVMNLGEFQGLKEHLLCHMLCLYQEIRACGAFLEIESTNPKAAVDLVWKLFEMK